METIQTDNLKIITKKKCTTPEMMQTNNICSYFLEKRLFKGLKLYVEDNRAKRVLKKIITDDSSFPKEVINYEIKILTTSFLSDTVMMQHIPVIDCGNPEGRLEARKLLKVLGSFLEEHFEFEDMNLICLAYFKIGQKIATLEKSFSTMNSVHILRSSLSMGDTRIDSEKVMFFTIIP